MRMGATDVGRRPKDSREGSNSVAFGAKRTSASGVAERRLACDIQQWPPLSNVSSVHMLLLLFIVPFSQQTQGSPGSEGIRPWPPARGLDAVPKPEHHAIAASIGA
jgi:hypothetical protein